MVQKTMFLSQVDSPEVFLQSAITTTGQSTIIIIGDFANKLLPAPNLFTIGYGEDAETIYYPNTPTGSDAAWTFTGCVREYDKRGTIGIARTWPAGTTVSRTYTAYDQDTFKNNIEDLAAKIIPANTRSFALYAYSSVVAFTNGATLFQLDTQLGNAFPVPYGIFQAGSYRTNEKLNWITHIDEDWDASTVNLSLSAMSLTATTGVAEWKIYAIRIPTAATMGASFGSAIATVTTTHANQYYIVKSAGSGTIGGSGNHILWEVRRGTGSDTLAASIGFVSLRVEYGVI